MKLSTRPLPSGFPEPGKQLGYFAVFVSVCDNYPYVGAHGGDTQPSIQRTARTSLLIDEGGASSYLPVLALWGV